jgi:hypothetical protein
MDHKIGFDCSAVIHLARGSCWKVSYLVIKRVGM